MDMQAEPEVSDRLREEYEAVVPRDTIDQVFREAAAQLADGATVQTFVPMLAERRTRERLASLVHS